MTVKFHCSLCGGEVEGPVVKVAAYAKPVSQDADRFLQGSGETDELATAFAHPDCAARLGVEIREAFSETADTLGKLPKRAAKKGGKK